MKTYKDTGTLTPVLHIFFISLFLLSIISNVNGQTPPYTLLEPHFHEKVHYHSSGDSEYLTDETTSCPNSNFSMGNFTNWIGHYGTFAQPWQTLGIVPGPTPPARHLIIPAPGTVDPYGTDVLGSGATLMTVFPGEAFSARLGNSNTGAQGEQLSYDVTIGPTSDFFIYRYAVVLNHNAAHTPVQRASFEIDIFDKNTGLQYDPICGYYYVYAQPNLPGWYTSTMNGGSPSLPVYWKDWTTVGLAFDVSDYGKELTIVFTTKDCSPGGHFGYSYISAYCTSLSVTFQGCEGSNQVVMTGPPGFAEYEWTGPYCAVGCTPVVVGTNQTLTISNATTGDQYRLKLVSFYNYPNCVIQKVVSTVAFTNIFAGFMSSINCIGNPSTFTDTSVINQNATDVRIWDFGDGSPPVTVNTAVTTHSYALAGTYPVTLIRFTSDPCSDTVTNDITVADIPPTIDNLGSGKPICSGENADILLVFSQLGAYANWTRAVTTGAATITNIPASQSGSLINDLIVNTGPLDAVVTYTITPRISDCIGLPITYDVTVHALPSVLPVPDQVYCNGSDAVETALTSTITGTTYAWTNDNATIGLAASGTGNIPVFTASNTGTTPALANITITPTANDCPGPDSTFTITINPSGQVNDPADLVVCNGASTAGITFGTNNTGGTTTYSWANSTTSIGIAASGTGNIASFTAVNTGTAPVVATVTVTPTFTNLSVSCVGPGEIFTITVNPSGHIIDPADQVVCNAGTTSDVIFGTNNTGGATTYSWSNSTPSIGLAASGTGDISSFTTANTTTAPVLATITVTPTFTNESVSCVGPAETFSITVNPSGQVIDPADLVVCHNGITNIINFGTNNTVGTTTYSWENNTTSIGLAASGTGNIASFTAVNTGTSPEVATITVTPTFTNLSESCVGPPETFTITVNPAGQVIDPIDLVACNAGTTADITFATNNTGGSTTYSWTNNTTSIGLTASGTGNIASFTAANTTTAPVVATITVTPTFINQSVSCTGLPEIFTITVNPSGQVIDPTNLVVCNEGLTTDVTFGTTNTVGATTYDWTNNTTSIGLTATGTGNIPSFTAINTGTMPVVATITVTPTFTNLSESCVGPPENFTITVNPTGQVIDPTDLVVCNGGTNTAVTFGSNNTGGATTFSWTNNTTSIGLAASGTGNIASFSAVNTTTAPVIATITVIPTFTNLSVNCEGPPETFTITVNPLGQVNDPTDLVVCNAGPTPDVNFETNNTVGITTYSWTNNTTSIGLSATGTGNIASFTAINNGTMPVVATITVTPTFTHLSESCIGPPETFTITVNPTGQVNDPTDLVACNTALTTAVTFATTNTVGTTTYNWLNNTTSIGLPASGNDNIASFTAINNGLTPVVATITVTPTFTYLSESCVGPAETFTITVNPTGQVIDPTDLVVCNAASTTDVIFATNNTGGTTSYSWTNDNTTIGLSAFGTGDIASFTAINTGAAPVIATITVTPTFSNLSENCVGPAEAFTIKVNPSGQVNDPPDMVVCNANPSADVIFSTNNTVGTTTYNWTNNTASIGLASSGTGNIAAFTAVNITTSPIVATITVSPTFTYLSESCVGPSETFDITVNPTGQVIDPADLVVCHGGTNTAVTFGTNNTGGTATYSWTNNTASIGLPASGTGDITAFTAVNTTTAPVTASITVTPTFTNLSLSCVGPSETFTITVNPSGQVIDPANLVVCNNANTTDVIFGTNNSGGTTTYSWANDNTSIGLAGNGNGNIPSFTAINTTTVPVVATITVTPTFTNQSVSCVGPAKTFTITVNPTGQVNDPTDLVACNTALTTAVTFGTTNTVGTTTYNWLNNTTSIGLPASGNGNIASFNAVNNGLTPVVATITVTPTFTYLSESCVGPTENFTITVNPTGQVIDPTDLVVCNNTSTGDVDFNTNNSGGTTTYNWTNNTVSIGLAAAGSGNIPSFTAVNTGTAPVVATITVTPTFSNLSESCIGPAEIFTITVNPSGQVNNPLNLVVCHNVMTSVVTFGTNNTIGTTTYSWTNNTATIGLPSSGTGNIASFIAVNTGSTPVVATITVTPTFTNQSVSCVGTAKSFTITVNPLPVPQITGAPSVCSGTTGLIYFTEAGMTNYQWTISAGGSFVPGPGINEITVAWNVIGPQTLTVNYFDANGCTANVASSYTVNVQDLPTPTLTGETHVCVGDIETYNTDASATSYVWGIPAAGGTFTGGGSSDNQFTMTWLNPGTYIITVNYTVGSTGCTAVTPTTLTVTVNPNPSPVITGPLTPICGFSTQVYSAGTTGNVYQWTITGGTAQLPLGQNTVSVLWANTPPVFVDLTETIVYTGVSCTATAMTFPVSFKPWPITPGAITGPISVCKTSTQSYSVPAILNATSYKWAYTGTGVSIVGNGTPAISITFSTTATNGTLTVTGNNECGDGPVSAPLSIIVHPLPVVSYSFCNDLVTTKNAKPFILKGGSPYGATGTYHLNNPAAPALPGNIFNPGDAAVFLGSNTIYYTYTTVNNCKASSIPQTITVLTSNVSYPCGVSLLTDPRDNNTYRTIMINAKCWMAENLRYGTTVTFPSQNQPQPQTDNCINEKYCLTTDNAGCTVYGGLYQWDELIQYALTQAPYQGACPPGWHIPTINEWQNLIDAVANMNPGDATAGGYLKAAGGFNSLRKGIYYLNNLWAFDAGSPGATMFWTSTLSGNKPIARGLNTINSSVSIYESAKTNAFPVRCVKD
ncbi:MAG: FISUMP domain-containing protein [Bacteroidales bacterium]|nr:FISUMP domain-containing protein [Bacteroidales bacterium]